MSSFLSVPFAETVQNTPLIVRGSVESQNTDWVEGPNGEKSLMTDVILNVQAILKGQEWAAQDTLTLRTAGGEKDGVRYLIPGSPEYQIGEEVVVFLEKPLSGFSFYQVSGMMMGKYQLQKRPDGEEELIGPGLSQQHTPVTWKQLQAMVEGSVQQVSSEMVLSLSSKTGDGVASSQGPRMNGTSHKGQLPQEGWWLVWFLGAGCCLGMLCGARKWVKRKKTDQHQTISGPSSSGESDE